MPTKIAAVCTTFIIGILLMTNESIATTSENLGESESETVAISGVLKPLGPPVNRPQKYEVGKACIIDLIQKYKFTGDLSGTAVINYRILVRGPCEFPPGTFDEEWIAHGSFLGIFRGNNIVGKLSYVAQVFAGGDVKGRIQLGQGIGGVLQIFGNFSDGELSYQGELILVN